MIENEICQINLAVNNGYQVVNTVFNEQEKENQNLYIIYNYVNVAIIYYILIVFWESNSKIILFSILDFL